MDMPGTGETDIPLRSDWDLVYRTVLSQLGGGGGLCLTWLD